MDNESKASEHQDDIPLHQLLDSSIVEIYVGDEKTRWPLPEKLLTYHSPVFASAFESTNNADSDTDRPSSRRSNKSSKSQSQSSKQKSYTLQDEENATFQFLVAYLYSNHLPPITSEKSIGPLLELYLLAHKLQISPLTTSTVDAVRDWYHGSGTYPGLRRVQYIYANTDDDNEMREMMISAVARQLTTAERIPAHWASALQRNGQLAVDIIRAIQNWHIEERSIPDARAERGRKAKGGFSAIGREGDSVETQGSAMADSAIGLESHDGEAQTHSQEEVKGKIDAAKGATDQDQHRGSEQNQVQSNMSGLREVAATA